MFWNVLETNPAFSQWVTLVRVIGRLIFFVHSHSLKAMEDWRMPVPQGLNTTPFVHLLNSTKFFIVQLVHKPGRLPKSSHLLKLSPAIIKDGLVRVGSQLERAGLNYERLLFF